MHEQVDAHRNGDVRGSGARGGEEDEIAGQNLIPSDGLADLELVANLSRQAPAVPREDVLGQPAAVEAG